MRLASTTLPPGGHCGFPGGGANPTPSPRSGAGRQGRGGALAHGLRLGQPADRGAHSRLVRLPATASLTLPSLSPEVPTSFLRLLGQAKAKEEPNVLPDLLEALYRERIIQPRHWEPGKPLMQVATDGLEEWAHRRRRLTTHPLRELGFIELHIAADIMAIAGQDESDWYECPWDAGWHCIDGSRRDYPPAALGLDNSGQTVPACALKPWAEAIQEEFGEEVARSFVGLLNMAVEDVEGWGPGYAYCRAEEWDDSDEDDEERALEAMKREIPSIAFQYGYRGTHLKQMAEVHGEIGAMGDALIDLARALPGPWKQKMPNGWLEKKHWTSNHACAFGAHPTPPLCLGWSNEPIPGGGYDAVMRLFDNEYQMVQQAENIPLFWLYAFDPKREGDGPGTLRFALMCLERQLRLLRAMDEVLLLLDKAPEQRARLTV
jgi:hypothetical protein